jgi:gas vesicle protein
MLETRRMLETFGIALTAAALGYAAGVLSAPASGRDTRRRLGRRLEHETNELTRSAERALRDMKNKVADAVHG